MCNFADQTEITALRVEVKLQSAHRCVSVRKEWTEGRPVASLQEIHVRATHHTLLAAIKALILL